MKLSKTQKYLEVVTNVAVLLVALAVLTAFAWGYFVNQRSATLQNGLQIGQHIGRLTNLDYASAPRSLLIVMTTKCSFCTESMPLYRQIVKAQQARDSTTRIVAVFPNTDREVKEYLQQNQLQIDSVSEVDLRTLNVAGTPTLILVDNGGKILDYWIGKLPEESELEVIKAITKASV
jgi:thioredoxin-related protein